MEIISYDFNCFSRSSNTSQRDLFTRHDVFQWNSYIQRIFQSMNLMHHSQEEGPATIDPKYFQWVSVDSTFFGYLSDSMKLNVVEYFRCEKICNGTLDKGDSNFSKKENDVRIDELLLETT